MMQPRQAVIDELAAALDRARGAPVDGARPHGPDPHPHLDEPHPDDAELDGLDAELRELVHLAGVVRRDSTVPTPDPAFRTRLRSELVALAEQGRAEEREPGVLERLVESARTTTRQLRYSARLGLATGLASMMVGSAGMAVAAQEANPGDLLYDVKRWTETARMALASGTVETGQLHLRFATERLEEVRETVGEVPTNMTIDTLREMDEASLAGARDLVSAYRALGEKDLLEDLNQFTSRQREQLSEIFPSLTAEVRPFADESLEVLRRIGTQISTVSEPCADCGSPDLAPALFAPGEGPPVPSGCDCVGDDTDTSASARSTEPSPEPTSTTGDETSEGTLREGAERLREEATEPGTWHSEDKSLDERVEDTGDTLDETVEDSTDGPQDTVQDPVEDTTDTLGETTDELLGGVGETLDGLL